MANKKVLYKSLLEAGLVALPCVFVDSIYNTLTNEHLIELNTDYDFIKFLTALTGGFVLLKSLIGVEFKLSQQYMASLVGQGFSSIFAAFAFGGAGFLFKHLDSNGYEAEMKRHNQALEDLAKSKEKFYENEVRQHDVIQRRRQELADANADIKDTNKALAFLRKITYQGKTFTREPTLKDFYKPSKEMKDYGYLFTGLVGVASGLIVKLI